LMCLPSLKEWRMTPLTHPELLGCAEGVQVTEDFPWHQTCQLLARRLLEKGNSEEDGNTPSAAAFTVTPEPRGHVHDLRKRYWNKKNNNGDLRAMYTMFYSWLKVRLHF